MLRQPDSIRGTPLLELVLAEKIQDRASGVALHGLRSETLDVDVAGKRGRAQQILLAGEQHLGLIGARSHLVGIFVVRLCVYVARCQHAFDAVIRSQEEGRFFRLHRPARTHESRMVEDNLMGIASESAMSGKEVAGIFSAECDVNLRHQRERVGLAGILHAHGPPGGLRCTEVDPGVGGSIAVVLVWISRSVLSGQAIFLPSLLFLVLDFDVTKDATHHWYSTLFALIATGVSVRRS